MSAADRIQIRVEAFDEAFQEDARETRVARLSARMWTAENLKSVARVSEEAAASGDVDEFYDAIRSIREELNEAERRLDRAFGG